MTKHSQKVIARALDMRERGRPMGTIIRLTGLNRNTIEYHCLKNGADSARHAGKPGRKMPLMMRGDTLVRPFSALEDRYIRKARLKRLTYSHMARTLDRGVSSIRMRLLILGRIDARAEAARTMGALA